MDASSLKALIASVKQAIPLEIRVAPDSNEYLEGVLTRHDLQRCYELLNNAFGTPVKEFGKAAVFEANIQEIVRKLGGIRLDQCLFLQPYGTPQMAYAALWPWASDPTRITLKVGEYNLP